MRLLIKGFKLYPDINCFNRTWDLVFLRKYK